MYVAARPSIKPSCEFTEDSRRLLMWTVTQVTARRDGLTGVITHITPAANAEIKQTLGNGQPGADTAMTPRSAALALST